MNLKKIYSIHREKKINGLQIRFEDINPLIDKLSHNKLQKELLGYSENRNPIYLLKIGQGPTRIVLWSQMHGDESTATKSLFDILNYLLSDDPSEELTRILEICTLAIIPMLNPDGAAAYTRENAQNIDLNRDAKVLQTQEGQLLHNFVSDFKPHFAFNLHDQSAYYSVLGTKNSAVLSFLAPSADANRTITPARIKAMRVIATMYKTLQTYLPEQIGRYNDAFNDNCFGDSFQMSGFPTILIESGYFPGDEMRETTRKYHFIAVMSALLAIASDNLDEESVYFTIPMNEKNYYDVRYTNVLYKGRKTDIAIRYIYILKDGVLQKSIDLDAIIEGKDLDGKLFHKTINAKGDDFSSLS
jgi:hypothetical protein